MPTAWCTHGPYSTPDLWRGFVGQVANLRTDCESVHPGDSPDSPQILLTDVSESGAAKSGQTEGVPLPRAF
jgi:hypothetical protein